MKCPFCQQELETDHDITYSSYCRNCDLYGDNKLWEKIDRTKKQLDIAKHYLMNIGYLNMSEHGIGSDGMMIDWCKTVACHALEEIKALEQKDVK